ncbi:MAG: excinuclease ABC subunit UvrA [Clostridia bacterium]|nr:excinuclease ABC subunit UvrA [Clostridia bacterium]
MRDDIHVKGARENNLKNIDVVIPRNKLVVLTGISGSGKSTLAFETIFAEGQRRYVESLSSYARMFLGQMDKPDVDYIEGLSPAISIDQKTTSNNPRSTVGTVTEIYDYLRLLYARIGKVHCPSCGAPIEKQSVDRMVDRVLALPEGTRVMVESPVVRGKKGEHEKLLESLRKSGYVRVSIDGVTYLLEEPIKLEKNIRHSISVVIDRLIVRPDIGKRLADSIEAALKLSEGLVVFHTEEEDILMSDKYACAHCGAAIEEVEPRLFSFNSPFGACPTCTGLGFRTVIDFDLLCPDKNRSLADGALTVSGWNMDSAKVTEMYFRALGKRYGFSLDTKVKDLPEDILQILLYGNGGEKLQLDYNAYGFTGTFERSYEGIIPNLERRYRETTSDYVKAEIEKYMKTMPCPDCHGKRLKKEALAVTVGGKSIVDFCELSVEDALVFVEGLSLTETELLIADRILKEIKARLRFLTNVGLGYLSLFRTANTLSGGEAQRIRLATQIGSGLMGVLYILDEPSIGLHQRDNDKLLATLKRLRDLGNTLIVVEHDEDTIRAADHIIDIGPLAGIHGGELVAEGTVEDIMACPRSVTGDYLAGRKSIPVPTVRRAVPKQFLTVKGARQNNLKNIDVHFPVGLFTVVTGVSGSGKSSLVNEILYPLLANGLNRAHQPLGDSDGIEGLQYFDKVIDIDQSPIGRTPRSNPATYTGVFSTIRELFAATQDAKERGYKSGRFSFNVKGGRCEHCSGDGIIRVEMHFLPDIFVPCEVCKGKRYNRETLQVHYKGKSIADVLDMTVDEAVEFFAPIPSVYNKVKTLQDVGLGYIRLGQSSTTLSGGEAQRVKLATELSKRSTGRTVYILDEPTTGLHMADVSRLIEILQKLCEGGNTVIVIEHNLDVIKVADYVVDLGKEGGNGGGELVAEGTPEQIAACEQSYTGQYLRRILNYK